MLEYRSVFRLVMNWRRAGLAGVALAFGLASGAGCSSSSSRVIDNDGVSRSPSPSPYCPGRDHCECPSGARGDSPCIGGARQCSCLDCTSFEPTELVPELFVACGGKPFGQWRLTQVRLMDDSKLRKSGSCPSRQTLGEPSDFRLELLDGGLAVSTGLSIEGQTEFSISCAAPALGGYQCEDMGESCADSACGLCSCHGWLGYAAEEGGSWSTAGSRLAVSGMGQVDYCVKGDALTLRDDTLELRMERMLGAGRPSECAARSAKDCEAGSGCHAGVCSGSGNCSGYSDERSCNVHSACAWQSGGCGGRVAPDCGLADFGTVPGCELVDPRSSCAGTPKPCSEQTPEDCDSTAGCERSESCDGPDWACSDLCAIGFGCTDLGTSCIGHGACSYGKAESTCFASYGCQWTPHCSGTVPPCSAYSVTDCANVAGCAVSVSP